MSFWDDLQQASFNGVPFGVKVESSRFGRRQAVHEYPLRDTPWVEDLGRASRRLNLVGFLLENDIVYGGGDVIYQRSQMIAAVEGGGPGQLVHPTLGTLSVDVLDFETVQRSDLGLVFEIRFSFIEGGIRTFPDAETSTLDAVAGACTAADYAASTDFVTRASAALQQGASVVNMAVSTAAHWAAQAQGLVDDARNIHKFVYRLQGSFGRYFGGRNSGFNPSPALQTIQQVNQTTSSLIAAGSMLRNGVNNAAANLETVASNLSIL